MLWKCHVNWTGFGYNKMKASFSIKGILMAEWLLHVVLYNWLCDAANSATGFPSTIHKRKRYIVQKPYI